MPKRRPEFQKEKSARQGRLSRQTAENPEEPAWSGERFRYCQFIGIALIALSTLIIYGQTTPVSPIEYEDPYYLVHSPYVDVSAAFSSLGAVWTEPYFANFHPVTTTTWLMDRALADKSKPFDGRPFRVTHLTYAAIGASLLILLYRRLGIPSILAVFGALLYAVHPIHTEVVAWLSARKDLISLIFMLLSFLAWMWARAAATSNQWRGRHALAIFLVLLAVLSKPIAVIMPAQTLSACGMPKCCADAPPCTQSSRPRFSAAHRTDFETSSPANIVHEIQRPLLVRVRRRSEHTSSVTGVSFLARRSLAYLHLAC